MSPKLPFFPVLAALVLGSTACGTLGKHYGEENESGPAPAVEREIPTASILVDSWPSGAIIRMNGIKIGSGPVFARPELDGGGSLVTDLAISADYTTFALTRNATEIVTVRYASGDLPPKKLSLARPVDGGVISFGGSLPNAGGGP